jgi:hypothetical protein
VTIAGPDFIPVFKIGPPFNTLRQRYSIQPCDLRSDGTIPVAWSAPDPSTVIESPGSASTFVTFGGHISGPVGTSTTRTLHVTVGPDLDGQSRESTLPVLIAVFERLPPIPGHLPLLKNLQS